MTAKRTLDESSAAPREYVGLEVLTVSPDSSSFGYCNKISTYFRRVWIAEQQQNRKKWGGTISPVQQVCSQVGTEGLLGGLWWGTAENFVKTEESQISLLEAVSRLYDHFNLLCHPTFLRGHPGKISKTDYLLLRTAFCLVAWKSFRGGQQLADVNICLSSTIFCLISPSSGSAFVICHRV